MGPPELGYLSKFLLPCQLGFPMECEKRSWAKEPREGDSQLVSSLKGWHIKLPWHYFPGMWKSGTNRKLNKVFCVKILERCYYSKMGAVSNSIRTTRCCQCYSSLFIVPKRIRATSTFRIAAPVTPLQQLKTCVYILYISPPFGLLSLLIGYIFCKWVLDLQSIWLTTHQLTDD